MNWNLKNKNAFVGGASKGIGKAVAIMLADMGANCTIVARNEDRLMTVIKGLDRSSGQKHDILVLDYLKTDDLQTKIKKIAKEKDFHILINNTGGPPGGSILDAEADHFVDAFRMHLLANQLITKALVQGMKNQNFGRVINIISTSVKQPLSGLGVSNTIRGAVANWSKTMANELGTYGITVNNVLPGATNTSRLLEIISNKAKKMNCGEEEVAKKMKSQIPLDRFASPSEVAAAVCFLASPMAAYITGINLPVDGGRTKSL